jgi:hypothetical protein
LLPDDSLLERRGVRLASWGLLGATLLAVLGVRLTGGLFPADLSAYLAAAETFAQGGNPYGSELTESSHFDGLPYVYPPGTLYLIAPLRWLPPPVLAAGHLVVAGGVLVWSVDRLDRRFDLDLPLGPTLLFVLLFGPVTSDLMVGNLAVILLGATVATAELADRNLDLPAAGALTLLGVVYSFKVLWLAPALLLLVAARRWGHLAALGAGLLVVAGLSALHPALVVDWIERVRWVRDRFPDSLDLLSLAPWFYPVALVAWLVAALRAARHSPTAAWLAGCASLFAWPRLAPYSFVLALPPIAAALSRLPPRRSLLLPLALWGPVYWAAAMPAGSFFGRWYHLLWAVVLAGVTEAVRRDEQHFGRRDAEAQR